MATLKTSTIDITPKLAAQWLKGNVARNRPVSDATINRYIDLMTRGEWKLSGEPIIFNGDGKLLNGQQRLRAVVASKRTIRSLVVRGVATDAFDVMDTGKVRTLYDVLISSGIKATPVLARTIAWALKLTVDPRLTQTGKTRKGQTNHDALAYYETHKDIANSVKFGVLARSILRSDAMGGALHYLFKAKAPGLADDFLLALAEGTNLSKDATVRLLRERLIKDALAKTKLPKKDICAMVIKTWNLARAGKHDAPRQAFAWTNKGPSAEDFPAIK